MIWGYAENGIGMIVGCISVSLGLESSVVIFTDTPARRYDLSSGACSASADPQVDQVPKPLGQPPDALTKNSKAVTKCDQTKSTPKQQSEPGGVPASETQQAKSTFSAMLAKPEEFKSVEVCCRTSATAASQGMTMCLCKKRNTGRTDRHIGVWWLWNILSFPL